MDQSSIPTPQLIEEAINGAFARTPLDPDVMATILSLPPTETKLAEIVFEAARELRHVFFGEVVFLYGFVYLSTHCRNDCSFCNYRASNGALKRYRKEPSEIVDAALELAESGVNLIDLTLGEDSFYLSGKGYESLLRVIEKVSKNQTMPVMLSPGVLDDTRLAEAKSAGATWYALYQETHNRTLFRRLRPGQDFMERLEAKNRALEAGLLIEDGILIGVGASPLDLVYSIQSMVLNKASQLRAMAYTPVPGGLSPEPGVDRGWQELLAIACMRLAKPEALIPASLDVDGLAGLEPRLMAGANVVTSIVPPFKGLRGVASMDLDIDNSNRRPEKVMERLDKLDLRAGNVEYYYNFFKHINNQTKQN
jgi:methylornithine synthase